jgi:hypothetical protein
MLEGEEGAEEHALRLSEMLVYYGLGIATPGIIKDLWKKLLLKGKSIKIDGCLTAVIFASEWFGKEIGVDEFLASDDVEKELLHNGKDGEWVTIMRSPVVSHQNFPKVRHAGNALFMPERVIIMHPDAAKRIQGDGDDHVLIMFDIMSTFKPSSDEEPIGRSNEDLGYEFSRFYFYVKGYSSQQSIGTTFNMMLEVIAHLLDQGETDLTEVFDIFGCALDAFAQGIKKNKAVPNLLDLRRERNRIMGYNPDKPASENNDVPKPGEYTMMAHIYLQKGSANDISYYASEVWDVNLPITLTTKKPETSRKLTMLNDQLRKWMDDVVYYGITSHKSDVNVWLGDHFFPKKHGKPNYKGSLASSVTWVKAVQRRIEAVTGTFDHIKDHLLAGDDKFATNLYTYLDMYAYVAYKLFSMDPNGANEAITKRREAINSIIVLCSQLTEEAFGPRPLQLEYKPGDAPKETKPETIADKVVAIPGSIIKEKKEAIALPTPAVEEPQSAVMSAEVLNSKDSIVLRQLASVVYNAVTNELGRRGYMIKNMPTNPEVNINIIKNTSKSLLSSASSVGSYEPNRDIDGQNYENLIVLTAGNAEHILHELCHWAQQVAIGFNDYGPEGTAYKDQPCEQISFGVSRKLWSQQFAHKASVQVLESVKALEDY